MGAGRHDRRAAAVGRPPQGWARRAALAALAAWPALAHSLSPTGLKHSWVAGTGDAGSADGPFMVAEFDQPSGIVHEAGEERLIVADRGNSRLRAVLLAERNRTLSLAFKDPAGGAFKFVSPLALAWDPQGRLLYCLDVGRPGLAAVDLAKREAAWLRTQGLDAAALAQAGGLQALGDGRVLLLLRGGTALGLIEPVSGTAQALGLSGPPFQDLGVDGGQLFAIARGENGVPGSLHRFEGGLAAVLDAFGSTAPAALAVAPYGEGAPAEPWGFVRSPQGLKVACNHMDVMAFREPDGRFSTGRLYDTWARALGEAKPRLSYAWDPEDEVQPSPSEAPLNLPMVRRPAWVCEDHRGDRWYVADTSANRIVAIRRTLPSTRRDERGVDGLPEESYARKAAPGTYRIALIGPSFFLSVKDLHLRSRSFAKRLEWHLNFLSSFRNGPRFDVLFFNQPLGERDSVLNAARRLRDRIWVEYGVDELVLCYTPRMVLNTVAPYRSAPTDEKGLPQVDSDPEFFLDEVHHPERWEDPAYQRLASYIRKNQGEHSNALHWQDGRGLMVAELGGVSEHYYNRDIVHEAYNRELFAFLGSYYDRMRPELEASAKAAGKPLRVTMLLTAEGYSLGYQERDSLDLRMPSLKLFRKHFAGWADASGARLLDIAEEMRVYSMDVGNLGVVDLDHLTAEGCEILALVTAHKYFSRFAAEHGLQP